MSALNLSVLKRHDPAVSEIVEQPAYVHLYKYADGSWAKTGIEGTLLLFRRSRGVAHGFFILNRNGLENFSADLTSEDDVELNDPLIIINPPDSDDVHGIYVTDKDRSASIGRRMLELGQLSRSASEIGLMPPPKQSSSRAAASNAPASSQQQSGADLLAMLTQGVEKRAAASQPAPTAAPDQQRLLDKLFSNAQSAPNGRPGHQRQSSEQTLEDIKAAQANGQLVLQRLGLSPQPVQHQPAPASAYQQPPQRPQPQQPAPRSPPAIGLVPRRVSDRNRRKSSPTVATAPLPPIAASAPPPVVPEAARPRPTPVEDVDQTISTYDPALNDDGSPLSSRDYIRHLLTLTEPSFVDALYQRYLARVAPVNGAR